MKINTGYIGIPKQLYHTSYSPLESSRASSLTSQPLLHAPLPRPDPSPLRIVRDLRSNLSGSQASHDLHAKPPHDYYSKSTAPEDFLSQLQQRLEDLTKKVGRNTEDIKGLKQREKTAAAEVENRLGAELERVQQKQALLNEECLLKIVQVKEELLAVSSRAAALEGEWQERASAKLDEKLLIKVRNLMEERVKQETAKVRLIIENETNKLVHELRWELKRESSPLKSALKYPFAPLKLTCSEFIEATQQGKTRLSTRESSESPRSGRYVLSEERTYFVDKDGYLLDEDNYYLVDEGEKMIRLSASMVAQLRREGMLRE